MLLAVVVLVISCKGKDNLGAQSWVGANVIGAEFTVIAKGGEVASERMNQGLLARNGGGVVDEEN